MKRSIAASILLGCVFLVLSCSKSNTPAPALSVTGTWVSTSRSWSGCTDSSSNGTETCTVDCPWKFIFAESVFTNVNIPGFIGSGTYTITSNSITMTSSSGLSTDFYNLSVTATTMTLTSNPDGGCVMTMSYTKL